MIVVQESEQTVVLFMCDRIVFVRMALCTLDCQAKDAFADGVHPIEHRIHAKLFRIDASFLVQHRVPQEARGNDLILSRVRQ